MKDYREAEKSTITDDSYVEKDKKLGQLTVEKAKEMFCLSNRLEIYTDEIYDLLIRYIQRIEREEGIKGVVDFVQSVRTEVPEKEIEFAQINSVLEVIISITKKHERIWRQEGVGEETVSEGTQITEKEKEPNQEENSKYSTKTPSKLGLSSIKQLASITGFWSTQTAPANKVTPQETNAIPEEKQALDNFFSGITAGFLDYLIDAMDSLNSTKIFSGEWEGITCPNLQMDFIELTLTLIEGYATYSVIFSRPLIQKDRIHTISQKMYKMFLEILTDLRIEEIESELVGCLTLSICTSILVKGDSLQMCYALFSQEGNNILSNKNIQYVQTAVLKTLGLLYYKEKNEAFIDIIYSFFTTGCLDPFEANQKKQIIEQSVDILTKSVEPKRVFSLIRKIMYSYESAAQYSEGMALMISTLLSKIKTREKSNIREINGFFMRIIARSPNKIEHIEPYCMFLTMHEIDIPLHHLIRRYDPQFIATFYSTYFRHPFTLEKGTKAVGDFINFVNLSDNLTYIYIMNMVPFIPTSPFIVHKLFVIYKRIYANADIFPRGVEIEMLLLRMKTPALVGIAGFIFSDPKPLINKKRLKQMAESIRISSTLSEDYIVFLVLVYSVERAKLENYNYKGILAYLKDSVTLKYMGQHLPQILERIHREMEVESKDFYKTYACELLKVAASPYAYPLSLRMIVAILRVIFQKEGSVSLSEELHIRFKECLDMLRSREFSMYNIKATFQEYIALYEEILRKLKKEVTEAYNYIVLNIVDLGLFHALPVMRDERGIKELLDRSNLIMQIIREFPTAAMQGTEIWEWLFNKCINRPSDHPNATPAVILSPRMLPEVYPTQSSTTNSMPASPKETGSILNPNSSAQTKTGTKVSLTEEEYNHLLYLVNTEWIGDLITIRGDTPGIIENTRNYLRWMLSEDYSLEALLVLLKVSTKEEKKDLLKQAALKGYNLKEDLDVYYQLYLEAKDTPYAYAFAQVYNFLCSLNNTKKHLKTKEPKEQELYALNTDSLIFLATEYNLKKASDILMKKQVLMSCGFFIDLQRLTVIDALSVISSTEDEQEIGKAIGRLNAEENTEEGLVFYAPQIVQLLKKQFKKNGDEIKMALINTVKHKTTHALIWEIRAQSDPSLQKYEDLILKSMSQEDRDQYDKVSVFLKNFATVSETLKKYVSLDRDEKKKKINKAISEVTFPEGCYLPITGETVISVVEGSGKALQSAEKVPYMVSFKVQDKESAELQDRAVIFKFGDDCRQDVLALQIIKLFQDIFKEKGLSLFLYPYKVLATGSGTGIIEVIPGAVSRDQIGRERVNSLVDYFSLTYGYREGHKYTKALENFIESFAGYSLVTYILNIKDRHNGNIMITDKGHLIHIDFGFMFDISPGNINIESPIKITDEIFTLLGGFNGEAFSMYKDLMVKGFYVLRKRAREIVLMVDLGRHGGLPCYTSTTVKNLISRFRLDLKDEEVPKFVHNLISSSTKKLRTWIYDQYQHLTNNIAF
ncbi:phosphatidylinositol 4-kinase A [Nematocida sp. AWRm80]|nr:phosphatidylinositol 4-kinase A [Nematocida sp. AWRm80]